MSTPFSEFDRSDLREFYCIYDSAKVDSVDGMIESCVARNVGPEQLFAELYSLYGVARLPDREDTAQRLRETVPEAAAADVERALRLSEVMGIAASDVLQALRRGAGAQHPSAALPAARQRWTELDTDTSTIFDCSKLSFAGHSRETMDAIMADECREWVANVVGDAHNAEVLREANFVDALRNGVVLLVLLQKLQNPSLLDDELWLPKRSSGFYARDNVVFFLKEASRAFHLADTQLFTDSDLCDGKNDRAVVTCLLSISRAAYTSGSTKYAPKMIIYEQEIDAKLRSVTERQISDVFSEISCCKADDLGEVASKVEEKRYVVDTSAKGQICFAAMFSHSEPGEILETKMDREVLNGKTKSVIHVEAEKEKEENASIFVTNKIGEDSIIAPLAMASGDMTAKVNKENIIESAKKNDIYYTNTLGNGKHLKKNEKTDSYASDVTMKERLEKPKISLLQANKTPNANKSSIATSDSLPKYYPRKSDEIDLFFGAVVNAHFRQYPQSQIRFHRLSSCVGEYIVYHRTKGHKRLIYACILQGKLLIRQSGSSGRDVPSWVGLRNWLERFEDECGASNTSI